VSINAKVWKRYGWITCILKYTKGWNGQSAAKIVSDNNKVQRLDKVWNIIN
jgi:hypothetical protein